MNLQDEWNMYIVKWIWWGGGEEENRPVPWKYIRIKMATKCDTCQLILLTYAYIRQLLLTFWKAYVWGCEDDGVFTFCAEGFFGLSIGACLKQPNGQVQDFWQLSVKCKNFDKIIIDKFSLNLAALLARKLCTLDFIRKSSWDRMRWTFVNR